LVFAAVIAAVLLALPLRDFGNVLDVLPLVGALIRVDVTYMARAFTGSEFDDTVRAYARPALGAFRSSILADLPVRIETPAL
jgi:hypothetical protein